MDFGPKLVNRIKNFKLPTRNQSIFLGTAGTIGGLLFFDQNSVAAIQDDLKRQASIIANEPAAWNERPRKVKVFFDSSYWPTYWFNEFAKPVLDAGAIDYEIIEGKHPSDIIKKARDLVLDAKAQKSFDSNAAKFEQKYNNRGWFSWTGGLSMSEIQVLQKKFDDDSAKKFNPLVHYPIFDPTVGLVAVGPRSWRHLLFGLQYGLVTEVADKGELGDTISELAIKDFNVPLPKVAFISSIDREGFLKFFYRRSIGWFTKRYMAQEIGNQALSIVQNKSRPFRDEDLVLGSENLEPWPLKKEPSESEVRMKNWTDKADSLELDNNFLAALEVYSN